MIHQETDRYHSAESFDTSIYLRAGLRYNRSCQKLGDISGIARKVASARLAPAEYGRRRLESLFDDLARASVMHAENEVKVAVNGTADQFPENSTIRDILASKTLREEIVIVFLNGEMTKSESWGETRLKSGDKIEIIRVVGGG